MQDAITSLESLDGRIALEAQFIKDIANTVRDVIPNMIYGTKKIFNHFRKIEKSDLYMLDLKIHVVERLFKETNYANICDSVAISPEGLSSTYDQLALRVLDCVKYSNNVPPRLNDYSALVSGIINSAENRKSLADYSGVMKQVDVERNNVNDEYGKLFTKGSVKSVRKFSDIIENNTTWLECIPVIEEAMKQATKYKTNDIQKSVDNLSILLDGLNDRVSNGTAVDFTPETLKTLSATTLTVARDVEFYGVTMFRLSETKRCYEETCKNIMKMLGKK